MEDIPCRAYLLDTLDVEALKGSKDRGILAAIKFYAWVRSIGSNEGSGGDD